MPQTELGSTKVPRRRWTIALLLGVGVLVNYFDRVNLSVSRDALQVSFGISAVMFGYLSSAYNWTYALLQLPSGLLLDRFGVRRVGIISTMIWSVASFAAAMSTGMGGLFGARFLLGIGEAPTFPANAKAIGYWFPKNERSMATAMFDAMAKFASAIGVPLGFASYNYTFYLLLTWLPAYLSAEHHIDLLHSAFYTSVPWLFATFMDLAIGGWLVDLLIQRGWNPVRVRQVVLIGGTALGLGILGAANAHTAATALFWISISIGGLSAASPVGWSIPSLIAPRESVGTVGGILNFCSQLAGIAAPIATGYIVQATHSFFWAFAGAGAFLLIGIAGYIFLLGSMAPIPEPA